MNSEEARAPFCQSCAMPLARPEDFGTEANGIRSNDYCTYCYEDGEFTAPSTTMEEMRDFCIGKLIALELMPHDEASRLMHEVIPQLKRWSATP